MGFFKKIFGRVPVSAEPSEGKRQLKAFDPEGRAMLIDWNVYRTDVLPRQFSDAGQDPDKLYGAIVLALNDEFFAEAVAPSRRLLKVDKDAERATTVLGIALMRSGQLAEAQKLYEGYLREHGESGIILTNLAKVHSELGEKEAAERTLWRALEVDPNQSNGLDWWGAIHSERSGKSGFLKAMAQAAAIEGSYRPQLWIARDQLESGRTEEALDTYRKILPLVLEDGDALMMLTGDLGNHGRIKEAVLMVRSAYRSDRHGPMTGINLVNGLIEMKRYRDAHELLDELDGLRRFDLKTLLDELRASIPDAGSDA